MNIGYNIELFFPDIDYTIDTLYLLLLFKLPVQKLSNYYIINAVIVQEKTKDLQKIFTENGYIKCYLTIDLIKINHECHDFNSENIQNIENSMTNTIRNVVKDKPLYVIQYIEEFEKYETRNSTDDYISLVPITMIAIDPKTYYLSNDNQLSYQHLKSSLDDIFNRFLTILYTQYSIESYSRINFSKTNNMYYIQSDVSMLELPYYITKHYTDEFNNDIPIYYYDDFSSMKIFYNRDVYKIYSLNNTQNMYKLNLSDYILFVETLKNYKPFQFNIISKTYLPNKYEIFTKKDKYTENIQLKKLDKNINVPKIKHNKKLKYFDLLQSSEFAKKINIYNKYTNIVSVKEFVQNVETVKRVRFYNVEEPDLFDIGILYSFDGLNYNSTFLNLVYYYYRQTTQIYNLDIFGDLIVYR